jgi:membrane protein DedA with SNARE-associated domain
MDLFGLDLLAVFSFEDVLNWVSTYGYVMLFGLLFACGLGLPLPEDIPLIVAGILVGSGRMDLLTASICAWCGIIGGDCVLYYMGHKYGLNITRVPFIGKHVSRERIERAEQLFARYGIWVVAIGRLFAGIRGAMVVAAGTIRFNFVKFVIADGLAALVSGGLFVALGMWFGSNLDTVKAKMHEFKIGLAIFGVVAAIGLVAYIIWRKRTHKTPAQAVLDKAIEKDVIHIEHDPVAEKQDRPIAEKPESAG